MKIQIEISPFIYTMIEASIFLFSVISFRTSHYFTSKKQEKSKIGILLSKINEFFKIF